MIDWSQVITAEARAAEAQAAREARVKAECRRRILAVISDHAQMNILGAAVAGELDGADLATCGQAVGWIAAMRAEAARLAGAAGDPAEQAWPAEPPGLAELASRY